MAGAFPISTAKFESLGIKSIQNTIISKTVSGKKLARQIDNQRFAFTVRIVFWIDFIPKDLNFAEDIGKAPDIILDFYSLFH